MNDEWKTIPEFPDYQANAAGQIRHAAKGNMLTPKANKGGYPLVSLMNKGRKVSRYVHDIIGQLFVPGYKKGLTVNHKNRDRLNNAATNLEFTKGEDNYGHGRLTKERLQQIRSLYTKKKMMPVRIASALGLRPGVVRLALREMGLAS